MSSCSRRPKPSLNHGESVEDWQLRILWEWQQKQPPNNPGPNLKQRKLLATETGLNLKWISSWFKKVNGVSKKKVGSAAKGAFSGSSTRIVAEAIHVPGSPKLEGLAEAILSSSTGVGPCATEESLQFCQSDVGGVNTSSKCERSPIPRDERSSSTGELLDDTELVLGPNLDLRSNRDHLAHCSSSHNARLVQASESPSALLHPQHTLNSRGIRLGYDLASPLQLVGSSRGLLSDAQHPGSCGSHTPHVQTRHFLTTLGGSQSVDPIYPKYTAHDSRQVSAGVRRPDSSVPTHVTSLPSLVPLPSIYWLLFDRDEHFFGRPLRGPPLSPLGELGGSGIAVASQTSATPVSFLARWEDILTLERNARSTFARNLWRAKQEQAQFPEVIRIEQDELGTSLTNSVGATGSHPQNVSQACSV